jgi:hypothetical protein
MDGIAPACATVGGLAATARHRGLRTLRRSLEDLTTDPTRQAAAQEASGDPEPGSTPQRIEAGAPRRAT